MGTPTTVSRRLRGESPRRQAERAVAQLHYEELLDIKAEIEAGGDAREIIRTRRDHRRYSGAARDGGPDLAVLRYLVEGRLAVLAAEAGPLAVPLITPREIDLGQVDLWLHFWAAILLGVALAQSAVDGQADTASRAIPDSYALFDAQFPEFWGADDDGPTGAGWPSFSFSQFISGTGAA